MCEGHFNHSTKGTRFFGGEVPFGHVLIKEQQLTPNRDLSAPLAAFAGSIGSDPLRVRPDVICVAAGRFGRACLRVACIMLAGAEEE